MKSKLLTKLYESIFTNQKNKTNWKTYLYTIESTSGQQLQCYIYFLLIVAFLVNQIEIQNYKAIIAMQFLLWAVAATNDTTRINLENR